MVTARLCYALSSLPCAAHHRLFPNSAARQQWRGCGTTCAPAASSQRALSLCSWTMLLIVIMAPTMLIPLARGIIITMLMNHERYHYHYAHEPRELSLSLCSWTTRGIIITMLMNHERYHYHDVSLIMISLWYERYHYHGNRYCCLVYHGDRYCCLVLNAWTPPGPCSRTRELYIYIT